MADYTIAKTLDYKGLACPMPIVKISQVIGSVAVGDVMEVLTTDPRWRISPPGPRQPGTGHPRDQAGARPDQDLRQAAEIAGASAQSPEMMKNIFQDMKVKISLQFEGTIINTNATYRDGSTVTLVEMDIGKLMTTGTLFKQVLVANPLSVGETRALFKNVDGLKVETNNPVTVEFK